SFRDAKVEPRHDPGRRTLKNIEFAGPRRDVRDELNRARTRAYDRDVLAAQVHVGSPGGRMKGRTGEVFGARNLRIVWHMQRAHAGNQHARANGQIAAAVAMVG